MDVSAWLLDPLVIVTGTTSSIRIDCEGSTRKQGDGNVAFVLYLDGEWTGDADGKPFAVSSGQLLALDNLRPSGGIATESRWVIVNVPKLAFAQMFSEFPDLHGQAFQSANGEFLAEHIGSLARYLPRLAVGHTDKFSRAAINLMAAAMQDVVVRTGANLSLDHSAVRARVERYIRQNLSNSTLSPQAIVQDLEIARATLYRAFAPLGGVLNFITQCRLEAARAILLHPEDHRTIGEIADVLGFSSPAVFAKTFSRVYGCSPRTARSKGVTSLPLSGRLLFDSWRDFLKSASSK
ncbi:helix-turn-helix transcriptional regulator [Aureimonas ureilytica]|uniref:helix-turn-helix transcriptional regulator n=1 Tax=Aureimonas ureilytica TaxID=401562 RepID=UPI00138AC826|nr:AraC family transcriptional regulator [Aureimonas ureilytica]